MQKPFRRVRGWYSPFQQLVDYFEQGPPEDIRRLGCTFIIAKNSSCPTTGVLPCLHINIGIADHPRRRQINVMGKCRRQQHAGSWFSTSTSRMLFMWAIINFIDSSASGLQLLTHSLVYRFQTARAYKSLRDAALVADYNNAETGPVKQSNCPSHVRKKMHFSPGCDVLTFRELAVDHPITI